jgi:hypothetical protein
MTMTNRALALSALLGALVLVSACEHPFGDEGAVFTEFELVVYNDSDEPIYIAVAAAGPSDDVKGIVDAALPGDRATVGLGGERDDTVPGGCLNGQEVWVFRNLSDTPIRDRDLPDRLGDIEVVHHIPDGTCFDEDTVEFRWPE